MDNNIEQWEREWNEWTQNSLTHQEDALIHLGYGGESLAYRAAHLRQQSKIDRLVAVLREVRECAEYWSEYDVPLGIVERMDAVLADHTPDTNKKEAPCT